MQKRNADFTVGVVGLTTRHGTACSRHSTGASIRTVQCGICMEFEHVYVRCV